MLDELALNGREIRLFSPRIKHVTLIEAIETADREGLEPCDDGRVNVRNIETLTAEVRDVVFLRRKGYIPTKGEKRNLYTLSKGIVVKYAEDQYAFVKEWRPVA